MTLDDEDKLPLSTFLPSNKNLDRSMSWLKLTKCLGKSGKLCQIRIFRNIWTEEDIIDEIASNTMMIMKKMLTIKKAKKKCQQLNIWKTKKLWNAYDGLVNIIISSISNIAPHTAGGMEQNWCPKANTVSSIYFLTFILRVTFLFLINMHFLAILIFFAFLVTHKI